MKQMFYYLKTNPNSTLAEGLRFKNKVHENWIKDIEVQDLSDFKPI